MSLRDKLGRKLPNYINKRTDYAEGIHLTKYITSAISDQRNYIVKLYSDDKYTEIIDIKRLIIL